MLTFENPSEASGVFRLHQTERRGAFRGPRGSFSAKERHRVVVFGFLTGGFHRLVKAVRFLVCEELGGRMAILKGRLESLAAGRSDRPATISQNRPERPLGAPESFGAAGDHPEVFARGQAAAVRLGDVAGPAFLDGFGGESEERGR